jgi:hypothetical protein
MRAISISRCDVVVPVGAVVKDINSLGDTSVPASIVAWFRTFELDHRQSLVSPSLPTAFNCLIVIFIYLFIFYSFFS